MALCGFAHYIASGPRGTHISGPGGFLLVFTCHTQSFTASRDCSLSFLLQSHLSWEELDAKAKGTETLGKES